MYPEVGARRKDLPAHVALTRVWSGGVSVPHMDLHVILGGEVFVAVTALIRPAIVVFLPLVLTKLNSGKKVSESK